MDSRLENKRKRLVLLDHCYRMYFDPDLSSYVDVQVAAPGLGLTEFEAEQAADQLIRDGLLRDVAQPWLVEISAAGIREVELAAEQPRHGADNFVGDRHEGSIGQNATTCHSQQKVRVLMFAANPWETGKLSLDEEARSIQRQIDTSKGRDSLEFITRWAARPLDLLEEINRHQPQIIHFSGHGTDEAELVLVDKSGDSKPVTKAAIANLLKSAASNTRVVMFNSCFSDELAQTAAQHVDVAIGMEDSIGDEAARIFATYFYSGIGFGLSVQDAFEQGKVALMLEGISEDEIPVIYSRDDVSPSQVVLL
jgi:hypothetical protein